MATLPGSIIGALVTSRLPRHTFNTILGILLIAIAIYLLIRSEHSANARNNGDGHLVKRTVIDVYKKKYTYSFNQLIGIVMSFFVGFLSSLLGIGGGIIHVPALASLLNFPV